MKDNLPKKFKWDVQAEKRNKKDRAKGGNVNENKKRSGMEG